MRMRQLSWLLVGPAVAMVALTCLLTTTEVRAEDMGPLVMPASANFMLISEAEDTATPDLQTQIDELKGQIAKLKPKSQPVTVGVNGRLFLDWADFSQDATSKAASDQENGMQPRAGWLELKGKAYDVFDFNFSVDFTGTAPDGDGTDRNRPTIKFAYITMKDLPYVGNVRLGYYKAIFGLEYLTSHKNVTFMERGLSTAFNPGYEVGLCTFNTYFDERATYAIGVFSSDADGNTVSWHNDHQASQINMRGTFLPWYDEGSGGRGLLHLGGDFSYQANNGESVRFRERPEIYLGDRVVDTGDITGVDYVNRLGGELAFVYGPFSLQSEYVGAFVRQEGGTNYDFNGYYIYASYFLTGEHRPYKKSGGIFDKITPNTNVFRVRDCDGCIQTGKGAWEVAYRYSSLDLNSGAIAGGVVNDHTLGLNWYLTPNMRMMWNYVHSTTSADGLIPGEMDIFAMRMQVTW